jgi:hypothetical protein
MEIQQLGHVVLKVRDRERSDAFTRTSSDSRSQLAAMRHR